MSGKKSFGVLLAVLVLLLAMPIAAPAAEVSKVSAPDIRGEAFLIGPQGEFQFKIPPRGSLEATLLRTSEMAGRVNGLTVDFSTGLLAEDMPTHLVAQFPSSNAIRFQFRGFEFESVNGFESVNYFAVLDGTVKPDGANAIRVIGHISLFRFSGRFGRDLNGDGVGSRQFVDIFLQFFWPEEGGVCQVFMRGPLKGTLP